MEGVIHINSSHLNYLLPLLKWRILDIDNLRSESALIAKKNNFYRIIRQMEFKKLISSYRDPFTRKKYVFLEKEGERSLQIKDNPSSISAETIVHDIKVAEIARYLMERGLIVDVDLEHQLRIKTRENNFNKILPDAVLYGKKNKRAYSIALELELSKKSIERILDKVNNYLNSNIYDYVLYFFAQKRLMDNYHSLITERLGEETLGRFMFFYNENLTGGDLEIGESKGIFKNESCELAKLFKCN